MAHEICPRLCSRDRVTDRTCPCLVLYAVNYVFERLYHLIDDWGGEERRTEGWHGCIAVI